MFSKNVDVKIDVEDKPRRIAIRFDRQVEHLVLPFPDAIKLAEFIEEVAEQIKDEFLEIVIVPESYISQNKQTVVQNQQGFVTVKFPRADRLYYASVVSFVHLADRLRAAADRAKIACLRQMNPRYFRGK